jgi:hypothetical protein
MDLYIDVRTTFFVFFGFDRHQVRQSNFRVFSKGSSSIRRLVDSVFEGGAHWSS